MFGRYQFTWSLVFEEQRDMFSFCMKLCPDSEMKIKLAFRNQEFMFCYDLKMTIDAMVKCVSLNYFIFYCLRKEENISDYFQSIISLF